MYEIHSLPSSLKLRHVLIWVPRERENPNHSDKRNLIVDEFRDKPASD